MLEAFILVCSLADAPTAQDCTRDKAVDVLATAIMSSLPTTCFMQGQAYLAGTEIGRDMAGQVARIDCRRRR